MSTVRVYKSTDPGAPAHPSATRGSMAALLRACLVEGWYSDDGTTQFTAEPAGWEEPYPEINNYACFRALSGVRQFYQVDDNRDDADVASLRSYDSMSDALTGVGYSGGRSFGKHYDPTYSQEWWLIADENTCYVLLESRYGHVPHGFGEYYSYTTSDPYKGFICGHGGSSYMPGDANADMLINVDSYGPVVTRSIGGVAGHATKIRLPSHDVSSWYNLNGTGIYDYPKEGMSYPVFTPVISGDADVDEGVFYGALRGFFYPGAYKPKNHGEEFAFNGKQFVAINTGGVWPTGTEYQGQVWIDITGSWEESP